MSLMLGYFLRMASLNFFRREVNTGDQAQPVSIQLQGMKGARTAETITLCHDGMDDENTLDQPEKIIPQSGTCQVEAGKQASLITDNLPAKSFRIYKIKK